SMIGADGGDRDQFVAAERHRLQATGLEISGHPIIEMTNHEVTVALGQSLATFFAVIGEEAQRQRTGIALDGLDPAREEIQRKTVCDSERDCSRDLAGDGQNFFASMLHASERIFGDFLESLAGRRQLCRRRAAIDQDRTEPAFEALDPPAESRLCRMPPFRRAREAAGLCEGEEILKKLQIHGSPTPGPTSDRTSRTRI